MLVLLLLPLVVVMVVVVVAMMVVVEVENGPALEEAGTATAPTPGLIPTRGPVDNATATPGSFRLFLSFSPCLCRSLFLSLRRPSSLPLLSVSATPASGLLSCFFPAQHLFSSRRRRRRLVLHILAAAAAPSAPTASLSPSHLTHATPCSLSHTRTKRARTLPRERPPWCAERFSFPLCLSVSFFPSFCLSLSIPPRRGCRRQQTSPTRLASRNKRLALVRLRFRRNGIVDRPANSSGSPYVQSNEPVDSLKRTDSVRAQKVDD